MPITTGTIKKSHYQTQIAFGKHKLIADEPVSSGGSDQGFSPFALLASALTSCTCITLRMYADRKAWPLDQIDVESELERDENSNTTIIIRTIRLSGLLSEEQRARLLQIANKCPVHKTLSKTISIQTSLL